MYHAKSKQVQIPGWIYNKKKQEQREDNIEDEEVEGSLSCDQRSEQQRSISDQQSQ